MLVYAYDTVDEDVFSIIPFVVSKMTYHLKSQDLGIQALSRSISLLMLSCSKEGDLDESTRS